MTVIPKLSHDDVKFLDIPDNAQPSEVLPAGSPNAEMAGEIFRRSRGEPFARRMAAKAVLENQGVEGSLEVEAQIGKSNFLPAIFLEKGAHRARSVCKIEVAQGHDYQGKFGTWNGTGFLVGQGLLLTNHHVLNSEAVAAEASAWFGYRRDARNMPEPPRVFRLLPEKLFITSPLKNGLDYTFVAVEEEASKTYGFINLERRFMAAAIESPANIIQHPDGRFQEVVLQENEIVRDLSVVLRYVADTEFGSSGSPVFDNAWDLIALHHASFKTSAEPTTSSGSVAAGPCSKPLPLVENEGIKISAIAADLEQRAIKGSLHARTVMQIFKNTDTGLGLFGVHGSASESQGSTAPEKVVAAYKGTERDLDIGFWNIEWFSNRYEQKIDAVASAIADMNLDVWGLSETSPEAVEALVLKLKSSFGMDYECAHSEPDAGVGKQSTSVMWKKATIEGERRDWPDKLAAWFEVDSRDFEGLQLEAIHGKVFNRHPGLFVLKPRLAGFSGPIRVVPLHLKAMVEGSLRRSQASRILAAAIGWMNSNDDDGDAPWIIGGDFNAELASNEFAALSEIGLSAITAADEKDGAFTYVKSPHKSLIDHIFVTSDVIPIEDDGEAFIVAADTSIPNYIKELSDHRPVVIRMVPRAVDETPGPAKPKRNRKSVPQDLARALSSMYGELNRPSDSAPSSSYPVRGGPPRVSLERLQQILADPETTEADLRPYVIEDADRSRAFAPKIALNPQRVVIDRPELGPESAAMLEFMNGWCRAARRRAYRRKIQAGYKGLRFVSEGDSWFQYPILLDDVIDRLSERYAVFSLDAGGDTMDDIIKQAEIADAIRSERPHGVLLSAGGNDLLGEDAAGNRRLATTLHRFEPGRAAGDYLNDALLKAVADVVTGFKKVFALVRSIQTDLPIFIHCYDYAIPGTGGPWLKEPMESLGIMDTALQRQIVAAIVDRFADALQASAKSDNRIIFVNTRNTVGAASSWYDELHPKEAGFDRVASKFRAAIDAHFK